MERVSLKNYNLKIYCCIYPHYEIVFLMIWVQYRNLNLRSSLHGISEKDFLRLELAHKSCMLSPSGNRTVNILCYLSAKKVFICKTHSAFTINTPSNKRPIKKLKKSLNARGLYSKYYVWNLQDCNSVIFLWPRDFSETYDICYNYVVKSAKWICKKKQIFSNSYFMWLLTCLLVNGIHSFSIMTTFYCLTPISYCINS